MQATMTMKIDTVFGNTASLQITAELDNPHELSNRVIFTSMAKMMRHMAEEIRAENERTILADATPNGGGDGSEGTRLALAREQTTGEKP